METLKMIYDTIPMELWEGLLSLAVMGTWVILVLIIVFKFGGDEDEDVGERDQSDKEI